MPKSNTSWNLQSFLDSLVYELDQARETLAVKGVNRPLTYAVKDLSLDLNLFPEFNGDEVKFTTAKPGDTGASRIAITLGSITDRQIRETTKQPPKKEELLIDDVEDIDDETKQSLKKIGVNSIQDIERLEEKQIDVKSVKGVGVNGYNRLADRLKSIRSKAMVKDGVSRSFEESSNKKATQTVEANREDSSRKKTKYQPKSTIQNQVENARLVEKYKEVVEVEKPTITKFHIEREGEVACIRLEGKQLHPNPHFKPRAMFNKTELPIAFINSTTIEIRASRKHFLAEENVLFVQLDKEVILKMKLK